MSGRGLLVRSAAGVVLGLSGCGASPAPPPPPPATPGLPVGFHLSSPGFAAGARLPRRYTCDGDDSSPPLAIAGVPAATVELALVLRDLDAAAGNFLHWVVIAIPPDVIVVPPGELPPNAVQATTTVGPARYEGPCPPRGPAHHYVLELHALRERLGLPGGVDGTQARDRIRRATLAESDLDAYYGR